MSQRIPNRHMVLVDSADSMSDAKRARSATRKVYYLHRVTLDSTKMVGVAEERPFRMWFPEKTPEKIPLEKREKLTADVISMCSEVAGQVDWDCVLPERDVVDEVKMREKRLRTDMLFGPALRLRLHHYLRRNHKVCRNRSYKARSQAVDNLDYFARAEIEDVESDVLRQCSVSVYYPDVNYERESSALRDVLVSKLYDRPLPSFKQKLEIAVPSSSYAISVDDGGLCEILWDGKGTSILINVAPNQDVREYVRWFFRGAVDAVRLTTTERMTLSKYLNEVKSEKFDNAVRVFYNSIAECEEVLQGKDRRVCKLFPRAFVIGRADWNSPKNATMTYRAKWFTAPSKREGLVTVSW
ncbi:unnamed protein product [Heligmosomoides polygyrus]|uniref:Retrotransposon hot spot (RHS) protein n=1 Tax=Heligmosomoides polygyrus TaxID=6339 RepID=A0A183FK59_HELPZ|nr:unnamed protein product [Heligmosomoides polygyrus]